jgi:hypothetical protein
LSDAEHYEIQTAEINDSEDAHIEAEIVKERERT